MGYYTVVGRTAIVIFDRILWCNENICSPSSRYSNAIELFHETCGKYSFSEFVDLKLLYTHSDANNKWHTEVIATCYRDDDLNE